jgi:hypothetical protein
VHDRLSGISSWRGGVALVAQCPFCNEWVGKWEAEDDRSGLNLVWRRSCADIDRTEVELEALLFSPRVEFYEFRPNGRVVPWG